MKRKYHLDDYCFMIPNDHCCYWAGFLAADGSIIRNNRGVSIDLQLDDVTHLEKLSTFLKFQGPIHKRQYSYRLEFTSPLAVNDLIHNFNVVANKSLILMPPNIKQENQMRGFIRGYMDGDGSIWHEYNKGYNAKQWRLSFAGTQDMLEWIKHTIRLYVNEAGNPSVRHIRRDSSIKQLVFGGKQVLYILDWLYNDSMSTTRLSRKYEKYQEARFG